MYGMVNKAIVQMISEQHGKDVLDHVLAKADIIHSEFIGLEQYEDGVSVAMITAMADISEESPVKVLEDLGEFWIEFARNSDYGDLLAMAGETLPEILTSLDDLHVRVGSSFPNLMPPTFWCTNVSDHSLTLHYASKRSGLSPMVIGLVRGLANMLDIECDVVQSAVKGEGSDHDEFFIQF